MARKTKEDSEKTRAGILDAALDVFCRKGFTRSTLNDIAKEAGVTRGAIYWHFKDKVDLLLALSEDIDSSTEYGLDNIDWDAMNSLDDLKKFIVDYFTFLEGNERHQKFFDLVNQKMEYVEETEKIRLKDIEGINDITHHMESVFERLTASGKVREGIPAKEAALTLMTLSWGILELWIFNRAIYDLTKTGSKLVENVLKGFEPKT